MATPRGQRAPRYPHRLACAWVFLVLVVFAFTLGGAMAVYPGGTFYDAHHRGFDFWSNFWCDALRNPALNGAPNPRGARLATVALWVLSAGLIPFWGIAAELAAERRPTLRRAIQALGVVAMFGMMAVTLLPSDAYPRIHGPLVLVAGPPGLLATILFLVASRDNRRVPPLVRSIAGVALLLALANLAQYGREYWAPESQWPLLPALQKVVTVLFLGWVVATCAVEFNRQRR